MARRVRSGDSEVMDQLGQPAAANDASRPGDSAHEPRRRPRRWLRWVGATLAALIAVVLLAVRQLGPRYGLYLVPPSPQAYADDALNTMDSGYFARGPEWDRARAKAVADTRGADSYEQTLPPLREALAVAGGKHSTIFPAGQQLSSVDQERPMPAFTQANGIATVTVPKVRADDPTFTKSYATTMADGIDARQAQASCGWIVDARQNHGGDMRPMLAGLTPLLADGKIGGFVDRDGRTTTLAVAGGSVRLGDNEAASVSAHPKSGRPVAVLQGPDTGSSGEVVVLAFKGAPGARSFGAPTAGYSSANQTIRLYDGTQMLLTSAVDIDRTGTTYGERVDPDQATPVDAAEQAATAWLRQQCGR